MFGSLAAAFNGAQAERERTPVRRQSRAAGKCEGVFWRRTSRQDVQKILLGSSQFFPKLYAKELQTGSDPGAGLRNEARYGSRGGF